MIVIGSHNRHRGDCLWQVVITSELVFLRKKRSWGLVGNNKGYSSKQYSQQSRRRYDRELLPASKAFSCFCNLGSSERNQCFHACVRNYALAFPGNCNWEEHHAECGTRKLFILLHYSKQVEKGRLKELGQLVTITSIDHPLCDVAHPWVSAMSR